MRHPLKNSFTLNQQRLDHALHELETLCVNVHAPKGILEHIRYFCGENGTIDDLEARSNERGALYERIASLLHAYIRISGQFKLAACSADYIESIEIRIDFYVRLRELIRCNVQLIRFAPGLVLYESTIALFNNYLFLIRKIQKEEHSSLGIRYINSRLDHYIKLREIISFDPRS